MHVSFASFHPLGRFTVGTALALSLGAVAAIAREFNFEPLAVPAAQKVTVSLPHYPGMSNPNPRGWYYKCANVVTAANGSLVACYQASDNHTSLSTDIVVARSTDGGKTWFGHRSIAHADVWVDHAVWVVPQMSVLRDDRIVIVCDRGERKPGEAWPMLSAWQTPSRGMANYVLWSSDNGQSWTRPAQVDNVGGEPGYVCEMANGTLGFARTESVRTTVLRNPPAPWGEIYYRNRLVVSEDGGKTWGAGAILGDDPFQADCEVGLATASSGRVVAATRIGFGNGRFGNPSRLIWSADNGRTWETPIVAPFYGQRPHIGFLKSGKLLVTYRHVWGSPGTRALLFGPEEQIPFQPSSWIVDEKRCQLAEGALQLSTGKGNLEAVDFSLYPAADDRSRVEVNATLRVAAAEKNGCAISAGCWVRFLPDRICLADRPSAGFAFDTRNWHSYRILRENGNVSLYADGALRLTESIRGLWVREVHFGNRPVTPANDDYAENRAETAWKAVSAKVDNPGQYSIDWKWDPSQGYPDQFRRDREVKLDSAYAADCGYSSWTQLHDGRIVIVDYTSDNMDSYSWGEVGHGAAPIVRAYLVQERDLHR